MKCKLFVMLAIIICCIMFICSCGKQENAEKINLQDDANRKDNEIINEELNKSNDIQIEDEVNTNDKAYAYGEAEVAEIEVRAELELITMNDDVITKYLEMLLINHEYENVCSLYMYSNDMKKIITSERFSMMCSELESKFGPIEAISGSTKKEAGEYEVISSNCKAEFGTYIFNIAYTKEGEIVGFSTNPPFDDTIFEDGIRVEIGKKDYTLPGILNLPKEDTDTLVIILPGSGPQDLNGSIGLARPYKDIADQIADDGIATYRFMKRTYYYGYLMDTDVITPCEDGIDDAIFAVKKFTDSNDYNFKHIYLLGHSAGGYFLPKIYQLLQNDEYNIDGMIFMAANACSIEDLSFTQVKESVIRYQLEETEEGKQIIQQAQETNERIKNLKKDDKYSSSDMLGYSVNYFMYLKDYDPVQIMNNIDIPVLMIFAENDTSVPVSEAQVWKEGLKDNSLVEFKIFPLLNHMFIEGNGWIDEDLFTEKRMVSSEVTDYIANWIQKNQN